MKSRSRERLVAALLIVAGCSRAADTRPASAAVANTGSAARSIIAREDFAWRVLETPHARIHAPLGSGAFDRATSLSDSVGAARTGALGVLGEMDRSGEPKLEIFLVDTRDDMRRIAGRPIGGFAQPGELTAVFVAGPGYRPLIRHEVTHAVSYVRWGELRGGLWLSEGLATIAQGSCQGHSIDEIAAGYLARGKLPSVASMQHDFRGIPELSGYTGAASLADHIRRRFGIAAVRALWQGNAPDSINSALRGGELESKWQAALRTVTPAALDSARLYREGC